MLPSLAKLGPRRVIQLFAPWLLVLFYVPASLHASPSLEGLILNVLLLAGVTARGQRLNGDVSERTAAIRTSAGVALAIAAIGCYWLGAPGLMALPLLIVLASHLLAGWRTAWRPLLRTLLLVAGLTAVWELVWGQISRVVEPPLSDLTAQSGAYLLYLLGAPVVSHGNVLGVGPGSISVHGGCTGLVLFSRVLKLALIDTLWFGGRLKSVGLVLALMAICFLAGTVRVAVLAAVVHDRASFVVWHERFGSTLFTCLVILAFSFVYARKRPAKGTG